MKPIAVTRSIVTLDPDRTHVLARPFRLMSDQRSLRISARVMGRLIIPYGISDYATTFATIPLEQVLAAMQ